MPKLLPREHGAYAELSFPLFNLLFLDLQLPGLLLMIPPWLLFFISEPLRVSLGFRGLKLQKEWGQAARVRLLFLGLSAVGICAWVYLHSAAPARRALLIQLAMMAILGAILLLRWERHPLAELWMGFSFSCWAWPVGLAGGYEGALKLALIWAWIAALHTFTVRSITQKERSISALSGGLSLILIFSLPFPALFKGALGALPLLALLPAALSALVLPWFLSVKAIRHLGWVMVLMNLFSLIWLLSPLLSFESFCFP